MSFYLVETICYTISTMTSILDKESICIVPILRPGRLEINASPPLFQIKKSTIHFLGCPKLRVQLSFLVHNQCFKTHNRRQVLLKTTDCDEN